MSTTLTSGHALVSEAQRGNMVAFAALVETHKERVYRTLWQMVGNDADAQDLSQEVFLRVYRSLSSFRGESAFTTWLHRLTVNLALDWLRARRRRPLQIPLEGDDENYVRELPSHEPGPEEQTLRRERRERLLEALGQLSPDYQEAITLYHFEGLSYKEISERLQIPVKTVETRLYRARNLLRAELGNEIKGGGDRAVRRGAAPARQVYRSGTASV